MENRRKENMKLRKLLTTATLLLLTISILAVFRARAYSGTSVYIDPDLTSIDTLSQTVGSTFKVNLKCANFTDFTGYEYKIYWNKTVLNFVSLKDTVPFSGAPFVATNTSTNNFDADYGQMYFVVVSMSGAVSGNFALREITFKIMLAPPAGAGNYVSSLIDIQDTLFGDPSANAIPHEIHDGQFKYFNPTVEDSTPPTTTDNYDGKWHSSDFTITLTATDSASGVANTFYKINNGPTKTVIADGQPIITTEGADNTLEYWSTDNANNEENHHLLNGIKLDKTTPTGSIIINGGAAETTSRSVTLTLTAEDSLSGVDTARYSNDGVWDTEPWEPFTPTKSWQLTTGNGQKTAYYQVADKAGGLSIAYSDSIVLNVTTTESLSMALSFNGVDNYMTLPVPNSWVYSFELWFNPSQNGLLIGSDRFKIKTADNLLTVWYDVNAKPVDWTVTITTGEWHFLVVVVDYRVWRVTAYFDGEKLGEKYGLTMTKPALTWVKIGSDGAEFLNGIVDELRIYDRVLTPLTVSYHYNGGNGSYGRPESNLIGGWHFDEGTGDNARDYSGKNGNGTIQGATWVDGHVRLPEPEKGDVSGDRVVNILDLILASKVFNSKVGDANWDRFADVNGDGRINILDLTIISKNLGRRL